MKLYYDKRAKDPIYYAQQGIRNGKKTTTKNVKRFGKHSELLAITDDPLAYVKAEIEKMNEEYRVGKVSYEIKADFNERVPKGTGEASSATWVNIGYLFIQYIMSGLELKDFFKEITKNRRNTFDCYTITRFLTYARILDPKSKYATWGDMKSYFEKHGESFTDEEIMNYINKELADADKGTEDYTKYNTKLDISQDLK